MDFPRAFVISQQIARGIAGKGGILLTGYADGPNQTDGHRTSIVVSSRIAAN